MKDNVMISMEGLGLAARSIAIKTMRLSVKAGLLAGALTLAVSTGEAQVYDLNDDWSDTANPNGVWTYREGSSPLAHTADWNYLGIAVPQPAWARLVSGNYLPAWFKSVTDNPNLLDFLTGDVIVHSTDRSHGGTAGVANVIWTSPSAATINISGEVWMVRDFGRGNTWQLYHNGVLFTDGHVSGDMYDRDHRFDFSAGSGGASVLNSIPVSVGDEIRLDLLADDPVGGGDFVGVNLTITETDCAVPFDSFDTGYAEARFDATTDFFQLEGEFTLGMTTDGIDPLSEGLVFEFGTGTLNVSGANIFLVPSGFYFTGDGFQGTFSLEDPVTNRYEYSVASATVDLTGTTTSVDVKLFIGDDCGADTIEMVAEMELLRLP